MPTVFEIVAEYLKANGYDGLICEDSHCGCGLDDLMPCGELYDDCQAAHAIECTEACPDRVACEFFGEIDICYKPGPRPKEGSDD